MCAVMCSLILQIIWLVPVPIHLMFNFLTMLLHVSFFYGASFANFHVPLLLKANWRHIILLDNLHHSSLRAGCVMIGSIAQIHLYSNSFYMTVM